MSILKEVPGVHFGPASSTWQAMGKALMEAQELVPYQVNNLEGPMETMACITCDPPELGTFLDFKDYKLIDVLTSLWDGQRETFEHSTSTNGKITIQNPWINLISATTPDWLKKHVPEEAIGGGFASRVIFVFANKKRYLVPYPGMVKSSAEHEKLRGQLIADLNDMTNLFGEMKLTPEAIKWGEAWYEEHWTNRPVHMASARFGGYIARKQTHIHKLAMVLTASRHTSMWVDAEELKKAALITTSMEADMISVFESIGVTPTSRLMNEMLVFIQTYQKENIPVTHQMLWRHCYQIMSQQEFSEVVDSAVKAGFLRIIQRGNQPVYEILVMPDEVTSPKASFPETP